MDGIVGLVYHGQSQVNISQDSRNIWNEREEEHILISARSFTNYKITDKINRDIYCPEIHLAFQIFIFHWQSLDLEKSFSIFLSMDYQLAIKIFTSKSLIYVTFMHM